MVIRLKGTNTLIAHLQCYMCLLCQYKINLRDKNRQTRKKKYYKVRWAYMQHFPSAVESLTPS